jgi:hypothetical protein
MPKAGWGKVQSSMTRSKEIRVFVEVTDESGNQQLVLRYVDVREPHDATRAWNFHSLVLRQKHGTSWSDRKIISYADFLAGTKLRRWISNIGIAFAPAVIGRS